MLNRTRVVITEVVQAVANSAKNILGTDSDPMSKQKMQRIVDKNIQNLRQDLEQLIKGATESGTGIVPTSGTQPTTKRYPS